jgi:hypothetical protein
MLPRLIAILVSMLLILSSTATAAMLFESGTLGVTNITKGQVLSQTVLASNVAHFNYVGARFEITQHSMARRIGGHFVGGFDSDSFFGAIVRLTDSVDFPDSDDLSTSDVLGTTQLRFPHPSDEVFGGLSVPLEPGWYAVVFGSSLFGTTGRGGAVRNGLDLLAPSYIAWQPFEGWFEMSSFFTNHRFIVEGDYVAEPSAGAFLIIAIVFSKLVHARNLRSRCERKSIANPRVTGNSSFWLSTLDL